MMNLKKEFGDWYEVLEEFLTSDTMKEIGKTVGMKNKFGTVYPAMEDIFKAFKLTQWEDMKVVILGEEPYSDGSSTGIAFGNFEGTLKMSVALRNILLEVQDDVYEGLNLNIPVTLEHWANQGVLMLNTALTVEKGTPESHLELWRPFTEFVLKKINEQNSGLVYMLWGSKAKAYLPFIDKEKNFILTSSHPSPLSAHQGFFNSKQFSRCNEILEECAKGLDTNPEIYKIKW